MDTKITEPVRRHSRIGGVLNARLCAFQRLGVMLVTLVMLSLLSGCAATSNYMHPVAAAQANQPPVAPPDKALVVFLRPSGLGKAILFSIMDGQGRFLGEAQSGGRFAIAVPPGEQMFVAWSENAAPMRANLLPGHVYYVLVDPRMGVWKARVDLRTISKRTGNWASLKEWMDDTEPLLPDFAGGQAHINEDKEDIAENLRQAQQALTEMDKEELMECTLLPNDGVPSPGAPVMLLVPLPPPPVQQPMQPGQQAIQPGQQPMPPGQQSMPPGQPPMQAPAQAPPTAAR